MLHDLIATVLGRGALYRFRADQIAAAAYSDQPDIVIAEDGALTAVALAALKVADDEAFDRIEAALRRLVPSLRRVFLRPAAVQHPSNPNPVTGSRLNDYEDRLRDRGVRVRQARGHFDGRPGGVGGAMARKALLLVEEDIGRESRCWLEPSLDVLRERGRDTGLVEFLDEGKLVLTTVLATAR